MEVLSLCDPLVGPPHWYLLVVIPLFLTPLEFVNLTALLPFVALQ